MQTNDLVILAASLACSIDALLLAVIWRRATRWGLRRVTRSSLIVGASHGAFAVIGLLIFTVFEANISPWTGDVFAIAIAVCIVLIGVLAVRLIDTHVASCREEVPFLLLGVDATMIGLVAGSTGGSVLILLIASIVVPALVFGTPLLFNTATIHHRDLTF